MAGTRGGGSSIVVIGYWLLAIGYSRSAVRAALPCSIMKAHRPIDVAVALGGIEEELDAAAGLGPLIAYDCLHHVALRFFVPGYHLWWAVLGFKFLPGAIQKVFIS